LDANYGVGAIGTATPALGKTSDRSTPMREAVERSEDRAGPYAEGKRSVPPRWLNGAPVASADAERAISASRNNCVMQDVFTGGLDCVSSRVEMGTRTMVEGA
jgi:hypothetical protein